MSQSGLTLAIETSNPGAGGGSVALGASTGGEFALLAQRALAPSGRHDDALMPAIDALLGETGRAARDLSCVAVSTGPGGFTSVRIAVVTAKSICEATGARCIGVPTAAVASQGENVDDERVLVTLASKREECWAALVSRSDPSEVVVWGMVGAGEIVQRAYDAGVKTALADAFLPDSIRQKLGDAGVQVAQIALDAHMCVRAATFFEDVDPVDLVPIYPREPEAVRKWRTLRAND